jgi:hypothetical protein
MNSLVEFHQQKGKLNAMAKVGKGKSFPEKNTKGNISMVLFQKHRAIE